MESDREEEDHGTEMQYATTGPEVYHHGNSQKDFFLDLSQPLVLSTPKCLLFTINFCISSEALCPSIVPLYRYLWPILCFWFPTQVNQHLVENLTILLQH